MVIFDIVKNRPSDFNKKNQNDFKRFISSTNVTSYGEVDEKLVYSINDKAIALGFPFTINLKHKFIYCFLDFNLKLVYLVWYKSMLKYLRLIVTLILEDDCFYNNNYNKKIKRR